VSPPTITGSSSLDSGDGATGVFDDADALVPHRCSFGCAGHGSVGVQVRAADAAADDADVRVGRVLDRGVGDVDDAAVAGAARPPTPDHRPFAEKC
jgi:hypothetical protein